MWRAFATTIFDNWGSFNDHSSRIRLRTLCGHSFIFVSTTVTVCWLVSLHMSTNVFNPCYNQPQDLSLKFQVMQAWRFKCVMNCISSGFCTESPSSYAPSPTSVYMVRLLTTSLDRAFWFQRCVVDHAWGQRQLDNCWPHPSILKHLAVKASHSPVQLHGTLFQTIWSTCSMSQSSLSRNTWKHTFSKLHKHYIHFSGTDFLILQFDVHCTRLRDNLWGDVIKMSV